MEKLGFRIVIRKESPVSLVQSAYKVVAVVGSLLADRAVSTAAAAVGKFVVGTTADSAAVGKIDGTVVDEAAVATADVKEIGQTWESVVQEDLGTGGSFEEGIAFRRRLEVAPDSVAHVVGQHTL